MRFTSSKPNDWVKIGDRVKWDDKVVDQATATKQYGKDAEYVGPTGEYKSKSGYDIVLENNGVWDYKYKKNDSYNHDPNAKDTEPSEPVDPIKQILDGTSLGAGAVEKITSGMTTFAKDPTTREVAEKAGKYLGVVGKVLGVAALANDVNNIYQKGLSKMTFADGAKLGLSIAQLALKVNPAVWDIGCHGS